jgi:TetR/AcrR family transcriptional regulator, cholesterol catabolism regulator
MFQCMSMKARRDKILDVAISLAEEGGFENVRQRDVAARAGVALGTLYKSFRSKEDLLSAALERDTEELERRMERNPAKGETPEERIGAFFLVATRRLVRKPNFARAVLRAMASGVPEIAGTVIAFHGRMSGLIIAALRGVGRLSFTDATTSRPTEDEMTIATLLQQVWFSALVGWSAGMTSQAGVVDQMRLAARLFLLGLEREQAAGK